LKKWMIGSGTLMFAATMLVACGDTEEEAPAEPTETETDDEDEEAAEDDGEDEPAAASEGESFDVGVVQYADHPSLDAATEGFKDALAEAGLDITYDDQNPNGDMNVLQTIADTFVGNDVDLIFANATPAAQIMTTSTSEIPILFTSVTDPEGAQLVDTLEAPGGNVTGTMDLHPDAISQTVELMSEQFDIETFGMVYNAGEQNSEYQVSIAQETADELGLSVETATVQTSADVQSATESLIGSIDAIYIVTDNEVVSGLDAVIGVAERESLPLFVGELDSVAAGGLAGFGFSYYDIGYKTGEMATDVLVNGADPATLSVEFPPELELVFNEGAAERMGLDWDEEWDSIADNVINE